MLTKLLTKLNPIRPDNRTITAFSIIAGLLLIVDLFAFYDVLGLRAEEGRRAMVSIEMVESGNYIVPTLHGQTYYNKPPVFNWIIAFFIQVFHQSSDWVIRLPGLLSFLLTGWIAYDFARRYIHSSWAALIAFAYLCTGDLLFFGAINAAEIDLFYSMVVVLQTYLIWRFLNENRLWWLYISAYILMAIGFLTKGFPSLLFLPITLLCAIGVTGKWRSLWHPSHFVSVGMALVICGGYFWLYARQADFTTYFINIFRQASQRTLSEHSAAKTLLGLLNFPVQLFLKTLPWSVFLPLVFTKSGIGSISRNKGSVFVAYFILANIWIYWLSPGNKIRYLYMFFPFLVMIYLQLLREQPSHWLWMFFRMAFSGLTVLAGIALAGGIWIVPYFDHSLHLPVALSIVFGFVLLVIGLAMYNTRDIPTFLASCIIVLLWCRLCYNALILPIVQSRLPYEAYVNNMIVNAAGDPVAVYGTYDLEPNVSLFGHTFVQRHAHVPLEMPYQIPYLYYQKTGVIMQSMKDKQPGLLYFTRSTHCDENDTILIADSSIYRPSIMVQCRRRI